MPAKSTSPEAAQKKVWKAELRDHKRALSKVKKDHTAEDKRLAREIQKLQLKRSRSGKAVVRSMSTIIRRIAILEGRIGL